MGLAGDLFKNADPQRWKLWGLAAEKGHPGRFLVKFSRQVQKLKDGAGYPTVVFEIGRVLSKHVRVCENSRQIFNSRNDYDNRIVSARQAIDFFTVQINACKSAINAWAIIAIRQKLIKDVRVMISKMVWAARGDAEYVSHASGKSREMTEEAKSGEILLQ